MDSPQSQTVSLTTFVSVPAASLIASSALATCILDLGAYVPSSRKLSLTSGPGAPSMFSPVPGCILPPYPGLCLLQVTSNGSIGRDLPAETQPQNPPQPAPNAWQVIKGVLFR